MMKKIGLLVLLLALVLSACQPIEVPAPIDATYDMAGPPTVGEAVNFEDTCLLPAEIGWAFSGDLEGVATFQAQIMHDGLCEPDTQYGDLNEQWVATGVYEGEVKGRTGTFDFFLVATLNELHFDAQMAIVPGSATGELTGISGVIRFDEEPGDEPPWPVSGRVYYYYEPSQEAPAAETVTETAKSALVSQQSDAPPYALRSRS